MVAAATDELYEREIKPLPAAERLRLLARIAADLAGDVPEPPRKRSILELEGLGAELWQGIDAQEYVDKLREEWDHRP
jgi:hypothetical protein